MKTPQTYKSYFQKYYHTHHEHLKAYRREWFAKHKESIKPKQKEYYLKNRDKILEKLRVKREFNNGWKNVEVKRIGTINC